MTNAPRQTKNQRREDARDAARAQREKNLQKQKRMKILIPTIASVAILAIVGGIVWAVLAFQPAPKAEAGPLNMLSDGILFETDGAGGVQHVETAAVAKDADPVPHTPREGLLNIQMLVDFSCPACKGFEQSYADTIQSLVAEGAATLEVHPVAILDFRGYTTDFSTRYNNAGACVAEYAPESFLDVMKQVYDEQPSEGGPGLGNNGIVKVVQNAGVNNDEVNACIRGEVFSDWVTAATARSGVQSTPTVIVNGTQWDQSVDFPTFLQQEAAKIS